MGPRNKSEDDTEVWMGRATSIEDRDRARTPTNVILALVARIYRAANSMDRWPRGSPKQFLS